MEEPSHRRRVLLPDSGTFGRLLPDSVQLEAADVMVSGEAAAVPPHDHGGLEEVCSALLQRVLLSQTIARRQLPAHIQVPGKKGKRIPDLLVT